MQNELSLFITVIVPIITIHWIIIHLHYRPLLVMRLISPCFPATDPTQHIRSSVHQCLYRPLPLLSPSRLGHMLWGNSSTADHSINLVLHAAVTLLYAHTLLHALQLRPAQVLISGLTFATHPVHTEAVGSDDDAGTTDDDLLCVHNN